MKKAIMIMLLFLMLSLASYISYLTFIDLNINKNMNITDSELKTASVQLETDSQQTMQTKKELEEIAKENALKIGEYSKWEKRDNQIKEYLK